MRSAPIGAGLHHLPQLLLQLADLVAQACGELELQLGGGTLHLVGQLLDQLGELGAGQTGQVGGVDAHAVLLDLGEPGHRRLLRLRVEVLPGLQQLLGVLVLAGEHLGDVGDLLPQRGRVDAVGGVVGDLLGPAPVGLVDRLLHRGGDLVGVHVHLAGHSSDLVVNETVAPEVHRLAYLALFRMVEIQCRCPVFLVLRLVR